MDLSLRNSSVNPTPGISIPFWTCWFFLADGAWVGRAQPSIDFSFGGTGTETILAVASAPDGYFVAGLTDSPDFPVTDHSQPHGGEDLFVAKLGFDGHLVAATRWGGSGDERATGLVLTSNGILTVAGWTTSIDCPVLNPVQSENAGKSDAIILQFNSNLNVLFASYYGGSSDDQFSGVVFEPSTERIAFVGFTSSTDFPFPSPNGTNADTSKSSDTDTDGILVVLNQELQVQLATYHGLNGSNEIILAVAADSSGNFASEPGEVAITGWTDHPQFYGLSLDPRGSGRKMFAGLLSTTTGGRLMSRVRGGNGEDAGLSVAYSNGTLVVGGSTTSPDFLVSARAPQKTYGGGESDGFMVAYRQDDFVSWATYLGGNGLDTIRSLICDPLGHFHLAGTTSSEDFPIALATQGSPFGGGTSDGFIGQMEVNRSEPFGLPTIEGSINQLSFAGSEWEEGFLSVGFREITDSGENPNEYRGVGVGGRLDPPPMASLRKQRISTPESQPNEQAWIYFQGTTGGGADLGVEVRKADENISPFWFYGELTYLELFVFNKGPELAREIIVELELPEALFPGITQPEIIPFTAGRADWVGDGRLLVVQIPELGPIENLRVVVELEVAITSNQPSFTLTPEATSETIDPILSNNRPVREFFLSERIIQADASIDIALISSTKGEIPREVPVTLQVILANHGPDLQGGILMAFRVPFPDGLDFLGPEILQAPESALFLYPPRFLNRALDGILRLAPQEQVTLTTTVILRDDAPDPFIISGTISNPRLDPNPNNNSSQKSYPRKKVSDLRIQSFSYFPIRVGDRKMVFFDVTNGGPSGPTHGVAEFDVEGYLIERIGWGTLEAIEDAGLISNEGLHAVLELDFLPALFPQIVGLQLLAVKSGNAFLQARIVPGEPETEPYPPDNRVEIKRRIGVQDSASISGVVYHDRNRDGTRNLDEELIPGAEVTSLERNGATQTTDTNGEGRYQLGGLEMGDVALGVRGAPGSPDGTVFGGPGRVLFIRPQSGQDLLDVDLPLILPSDLPDPDRPFYLQGIGEKDGWIFLVWEGDRVLECALLPEGPFQALEEARSPYPLARNPSDNDLTQPRSVPAFYRLRKP